jgi:hypothetical protein
MYTSVAIIEDAIYKPTLASWTAEAADLGEEGVFIEREIDLRLSSLRGQSEAERNIHGYFIVKNGEEIASSLLEISHAMPGTEKSWLKLLNVTLRPTLLPSYNGDGNLELMKETFQVSAISIMKAVELTFHELPSKELKIYGRTSEMQSLFKSIITAGALDDVLETIGLAARLESRWLVLAKV